MMLGTVPESFDVSDDPKHADLIAEMIDELITVGPFAKARKDPFPIYMRNSHLEFNTKCRLFSKKTNRFHKFLEQELFCSSCCGRHGKGYFPERFATDKVQDA
mmetsp:Transcript_37080/g.48830  ORF Transcript_37080/g.48830 Transcript_37080/m.48830 type:complete len:103 (-) Transcript_37080:759-1067(-)